MPDSGQWYIRAPWSHLTVTAGFMGFDAVLSRGKGGIPPHTQVVSPDPGDALSAAGIRLSCRYAALYLTGPERSGLAATSSDQSTFGVFIASVV